VLNSPPCFFAFLLLHAIQRSNSNPSQNRTTNIHSTQYPKTRIVVATLGQAPAWVGKVLKWLMPDRVLDKMLMAAF
jgi:hypothetical protein